MRSSVRVNLWCGGLPLIAFLFLLSSFIPAAAKEREIPVDIKADQLKYFEASGLVEARGSVETRFEDLTIYADRAYLNSAANLVTAEGNVRFAAKGYHAASEALSYDIRRKVPVFSGFKSWVSPGGGRGDFYLTAQHLTDLKSEMSGGPGTVTTCGLYPSHFYLAADKIKYSPGDRIEGSSVTLYVGETPVAWTPYFVYDLRRRRKNWVYGHNEVEGDFLKTAWDYQGGLLLLDYIEKKGWGYGTEVNYGLAALGLGTFYIYHLNERGAPVSDWVVRIDEQKQMDPSTLLKFTHQYKSIYAVPAGRWDQTAFDLNLSHDGENRWNLKLNTLDDRVSAYQKYAFQIDQASGKEYANYYFNYDFAKSDPKWLRESQRLFYRSPLFSDRVLFSALLNYYHSALTEGDGGEERFEPQVDLSGSEKDYSWRYTQNWFLDLRQDRLPGIPRFEFLEKRPEIEIYPRTLELGFFNLRSTFGYGNYREVKKVPELSQNRDYSTGRCRATLDAAKTLPLAFGTVMLAGAGIDQFAYASGDQLYAYRENAGLQTNLSSFFRNEVNYRKGYTAGNTPFFFDKIGTSYHDLREKLTFFHLDKFNWTIEGGRNWQSRKWFDVMTNLSAAPNTKLKLNLTTGWDIENRIYKDLVAGLRLAPCSFLAADMSLTQDMNAGELRYGSVLYDIYFLEGAPNQLHLRFSQVFDPATKELKVRDIMITKDLHCWEMKYTYSDYRKEFSLVFSLKAFPEEPVGFSTGRGFYYEGFDRELGRLQQGEVRRY
ncbi:hypothetical protein HZB08_02705 [Candidatus Saganbacteria bacterium]|uniref:LPS-assembly protein LptD n=1 Tax=Candidatus Saganbacteria bacterium TaxID=2575572 RepID=A0A9D6UMY3_UNCSA|nr:hypothetical protein [Candidatus Saganbacteria bacterium]